MFVTRKKGAGMVNLSWVLMQFIDCFLYLFLAHSIFGDKVSGNKKICVIFICIAIVGLIIEYYTPIKLTFFLPIILLFMMLHTPFVQRLIMTFLIICIVMAIQQYLALSLFPYEIMEDSFQIDLYSICCAIVIIGVSLLIRYIRIHSQSTIHLSDIPSYIYMNIILGVCAGILPLSLVNYLENEIPIRLRTSILCVSYFSIICSLVTVFIFVKNYKEKDSLKKENELKNDLLTMQERYFRETVKNYDYLRKFRHDIQGHFRIISQLENQKSYDELHIYIQKLKKTVQKQQIFQCPNNHISAIVNSYIEDMKKENIELNIMYNVIGLFQIDVIDLDSLVYNLLSNAFEAEKEVVSNQKKVDLKFMGSRNDLLIEITNDVKDIDCIDYIRNNKTSKKNKLNHGIGTENIWDIVHKYNGDIDMHLEQKRLCIEVFLNNVINFEKEDEM